MAIRQQVDSVAFYHDEDPSATITARRDIIEGVDSWSFNLMGVAGGNFLPGIPQQVACQSDTARDAFGEAVVDALCTRNLSFQAATEQLAVDIANAAVDVQ